MRAVLAVTLQNGCGGLGLRVSPNRGTLSEGSVFFLPSGARLPFLGF